MAKPLTSEFLISRGNCCGKSCINCPYWPRYEKGSTKVEIIKLLDDYLDDIDNGDIVLGTSARRCYMNDEHKFRDIITWVHDDDLKKYHVLRGLSKKVDRAVQKG